MQIIRFNKESKNKTSVVKGKVMCYMNDVHLDSACEVIIHCYDQQKRHEFSYSLQIHFSEKYYILNGAWIGNGCIRV